MADNSAIKVKRGRTTMVPVTTMEEVPVLSDKERAELTAALKEAQARIKDGQGIEYDPAALKQRLIGIYRSKSLTPPSPRPRG